WPGLTRGSRRLERPSWAPVVLSGALPRELSDLLAISILALASLESVFAELQRFNQPAWFTTLLVLVPLTCALAALFNSSRTQKEELALFAYGGSGLQIQFRYILRGVVLSVVGGSGWGKSTLVNIVLGLEKPTRGIVQLDGENMTGQSFVKRSSRVKTVAVFQRPTALPQLTVLQNLHLALSMMGIPKRDR